MFKKHYNFWTILQKEIDWNEKKKDEQKETILGVKQNVNEKNILEKSVWIKEKKKVGGKRVGCDWKVLCIAGTWWYFVFMETTLCLEVPAVW